MGALSMALTGIATALACVALALLAEHAAARGLRRAWLARRPLSGEHDDSVVYERSLWTPGEPDMEIALALLALAGVLAAASFQADFPPWLALPPWLAALGWDLWTWQRAAASVKFVAWQRGWRRSARRVAVSDLREVQVAERRAHWPGLPPRWQPVAWQPVLVLRSGKVVKLPRTGALFGGEARADALAEFVRLQIDQVADNRRRAAADKRAAARRALQPPPPPVHPATRIDPLALPTGRVI